MKKITLIILTAFLISGCSNLEKEMPGIYLKSPSINTVDSLFIFPIGKKVNIKKEGDSQFWYVQKIYDKPSGILMAKVENSVYIYDSQIVFKSMYWDDDSKPFTVIHFSEDVLKDKVITFGTSKVGDDIIVSKRVKYVKVGKVNDN
jgi:hypothetical protein